MSARFEELDYRATPIGPVSLRRRYDPALRENVFEVKLGEEFLMSSAYTASEIALATAGLDALSVSPGTAHVLIGGLGLGFTARAALDHPATGRIVIAEYLRPVIDWHRQGLLPLGLAVAEDARTAFLEGDFFAMAAEQSFGRHRGKGVFDAILLDIDHSPDALLSERSRPFYEEASLGKMAGMLRPGGVFGLWSDDPPAADFVSRLARVFETAWTVAVTIERPLAGTPIVQTVYLAQTESPA